MAQDYYLTQGRLDSLLDLPISLALTELLPNEWLIVSTIQIAAPQAFTLQFLQVNLSSAINQDTGTDSLSGGPSSNGQYPFPGIPAYASPGLGLAYIGLYAAFDPLNQPSSQAAQEKPTSLFAVNSTLPVTQSRVATPATYSTPGPYSVVVCNNTTNCTLRLTVLGQLRLDLGLS